MKRLKKTESVLEKLARALGASAGIAVHTGSDVAGEIVQAAKRIRERIAKGADSVKKASSGTKQASTKRRPIKTAARRAASKPKRTSEASAKR